MKKLLVATDFSERSDRALRRATLMARQCGAAISLVHVVDDDQPRRIVDAERATADAVLSEQAATVRTHDGVDCEAHVILGDPFEGIARHADETSPDIVVIGPHRRQALKDVFIGTTAERIIRMSRRPVLMANGVPVGIYGHVLLTSDLSACSANAARVLASLGLAVSAKLSILHVFDAPAVGLGVRGTMDRDERHHLLAEAQADAGRKLADFVRGLDCGRATPIVRHEARPAATEIQAVAQEISADLVVVGTHGRSGLQALVLGSVTEAVLRTAVRDVLAVPPALAGGQSAPS